jgi:penicillin amidase
VRKPENDLQGLAPAPGWDARYDWAGYLPFEALPRAFNPPGGAVVSANQKITAPDYPHHITFEWQAPYRARRIEELLSQADKKSVDSFARMQLDTVSLAVRALLPHLLAIEAEDGAAREALELLADWDGSMAADRPEPLIATAWWRELARGIYADELGDAFARNWSERAVFIESVLTKNASWCDDARTRAEESCGEVLAASLERALRDLKLRFGDDLGAWRWGEAHIAEHRHRPFSRRPLLARFFDVRVPTPGGTYTVNAGRSDFGNEAAPYANRHAAGYRGIYDLADPQGTLFILSAGQSGNPLSPHYRSFAAAWARGEYVRAFTDRALLEADGVKRLLLTPANSGSGS